MSGCPGIPDEAYGVFRKRLNDSTFDDRVPLAGSIELTLRCNLRCVHCYCDGTPLSEELATGELKRVIDEIADAGCMWLLITGGEPLIRPDFEEIYLYIKKKGIIPTMFTNATLVDEGLARLLSEWQPFWVEVSIYGATRETYESVTRVRGSFDRCMMGIDLLQDYGINLKLKTMVLRDNMHELEAMYEIARRRGLDFRHDALLNPTLNGGDGPASQRVEAGEVIELDRRYNAQIDEWRDFIADARQLPAAETLFSCGSGMTAFHVDPGGRLCLCLMARREGYNLLDGTFEQGWNTFINEMRSRPADEGYRCGGCDLRHICGCCAAWSELETGREHEPVDYLCRVAALRALAFGGPEIADTANAVLSRLDGTRKTTGTH